MSEEERELLERLVYCEARGEDLRGQTLVVNVILNRMNSGSFPDTVTDVIYQANQFSPVSSGLIETAEPTELNKQAVQEALCGGDHSQGALYFRSVKGAEGSWHERALTRLFEYGGHIFYK